MRLRLTLSGLTPDQQAKVREAIRTLPIDLLPDADNPTGDILIKYRTDAAEADAPYTFSLYSLTEEPETVAATDLLCLETPVSDWRRRLQSAYEHLIRERRSEAPVSSAESERYALMALGANDGLWHWDLSTGYFYHSPRWATMLGFAAGEIGTSVEDWLERVLPEDRPWVDATLEEQIDHPSGNFVIEYRMRAKDGAVRWMLCRGAAVADQPGGRARRLAGSQSDITDRKEAERALRLSEERYALAMQAAKDGLWDWDLTTGRIFFTPRWKEMIGCGDDEIGDSPQEWFDRIVEDDLIWLEAVIEDQIGGQSEPFQIEYRIRDRDGRERWMMCNGLTLRDFEGRAIRIVGSQSDISPRKAAEARVLHDAFYDNVTELPNRTLFSDRVAQALKRPGARCMVMVLEINRFRSVADNLGLSQSDEVLRQIARRLSDDVRGTETLARIDTALFALLLEDFDSDEVIRARAEAIHQLLKPVFPLEGGRSLFITVRVGAAPGEHGESPEQILRRANRAMNRGDRDGERTVAIFSDTDRELAMNAIELETELRRAIDSQGELRLFYQPIVELTTGRLAGFESLMRWIHPVHGIISPAHFIPLAEETGLIVRLGEVALSEACQQANRWIAEGRFPPGLFINVNVSPLQFNEPDFLSQVEKILRLHGTPPSALKLEITESTVLGDVERMVFILNELKRMGLKLAIDDFGTGYSSLSYLHRFKFDAVKIDQSFVRAMRQREDNTLIIRMIAELARGLGCEVIAEGIELQGEVQRLSELGCMYGQGYFFSPPKDADVAGSMINRGFRVTPELIVAE